MKTLDVIAAVLLVVGGLNWGLVSVEHFDLVAAIFGMKFGETSSLSSAVYALVGLAALYQAVSFKAIQSIAGGTSLHRLALVRGRWESQSVPSRHGASLWQTDG